MSIDIAAPGGSLAALTSAHQALAIWPGQPVVTDIAANSVLTTFSFTSIAATYKIMRLYIMLVGHGASLVVRFNNDSGANYQLQSLVTANVGATPTQALTTTGINLNPSLVNDTSMVGTMLHYNIAVAKMMRFVTVWGGIGSGSDVVADYGGAWNNTATINRVDVICASAPTLGYCRLEMVV